MKAFIAVISCLLAAASAAPQYVVNNGYTLGAQQIAYAGQPIAYANTYANAAPIAYTQAAAPIAYTQAAAPIAYTAAAPVTYATQQVLAVNPYDYAGQVYPLAEPYIHSEVEAEPYVHEEIPAEEYKHEEIEAEPYVHEEIPAEEYKHEEIPAEPYIHQEPIEVIAAPAQYVQYAAAPAYAAAPVAYNNIAYAAAAPTLAYNNVAYTTTTNLGYAAAAPIAYNNLAYTNLGYNNLAYTNLGYNNIAYASAPVAVAASA